MTDYITTLVDGEKIISEGTFQKIIEKLFSKVEFNYTYEKGYKSNDWYEPDEPASIEVDAVSVNLSIEELKKFIPITDETLDLLDIAIYDPEIYDFWDDAIPDLLYNLESSIPSFSVEDYNSEMTISKEKGLTFTLKITDYSFDENEYIEEMDPRNEYDPSEDL